MTQGTDLRPSAVVRLVTFSGRRPWTVLGVALVLCVLALVYTTQHFSMSTDTEALISPNVPWRQNQAAMDAAFPQKTDTTLVVVDGATPELAEAGAARLTAALEKRTVTVLAPPAMFFAK